MSNTKPILVIGDACLDRFVYCHCDRLCPEAPVPVLDIVSETENLGMSGNVWRNIRALGYTAELMSNSNRGQVTKTRYVDTKTNHMFLRIDSKTTIPRIPKDALKSIVLPEFSAVVISDYDKGFLHTEDIAYLAANHPLTFLDTKKVLDESWAKKVTFIKINRKEFAQSIANISKEFQNRIIVTLGGEGVTYQGKIYPVQNVEVKNLSGAGDSFLSGLVVKYVETGNIEEALDNANKVATIVVQKKGVSTIKD